MRVLAIDVGIKNLSLCILEKPNTIIWWRCLDCSNNWITRTKKKWPKKPSISIQVEALVFTLNEHKSMIENLENVVIENQPAGTFGKHSNTTMKCLQHSMQAWFLTTNPQVTIEMVSPKSKLGPDAP